LFLSTFLTTTAAGFILHVVFLSQTQQEVVTRVLRSLVNPLDLLNGLPFSFTILAILLAHEMGHYLACRFYGIQATFPYVIPAPPPLNPFGTFGAVIKIKSLFSDRKQLFDVAIAGPLAGFLIVIPALVIGLQQSRELTWVELGEQPISWGQPLLLRLGATVFFPGDIDAGMKFHPILLAAWFGMFATSMNLFPIGQLDGGHIVYAIFGRRVHRIVSYAVFGVLIALGLFQLPMLLYLVFAFVLVFIGFRHPRPRTEFASLGKERLVVALLGLLVFLFTFMPIPVRLIQHVARL